MFKIISMSLVWLLSLLVLVAGAADLNGTCNIRFSGKSTLHGFNGLASCESFTFDKLKGPGGEPLLGDGMVKIMVVHMDTDNDSRDGKMFKMFDAENFPYLLGHFPQVNLQQLIARIQSEKSLPFELTIRDITNSVDATLKNIDFSNGLLTFTAEFPVSLASFNLRPPGVLGIIRVADEVQVAVDVTLQGPALTVQ